jgi:hypothetical protein
MALKKFAQARDVLADRRIDLRVGAFQVRIGENCRCTMTGTRQVNHIEIVLLDQPIRVHVEQAKTRIGTPMPQQPYEMVD